MRTASGR